MTLTSFKLKKILDDKFNGEQWNTSFNREEDRYRVELTDTKKGVTITLPSVIAKYEKRGNIAIEELVDHIKASLNVMNKQHRLLNNEKNIYPVIRSTSFPTETKSGLPLICHEHTAETRIYYALDLGNTYQLIDKQMLNEANWEIEHLREMALFNMKSLSIALKKDHVAGNDFYFVAANDGYDASRVLNESWLAEMAEHAHGTLALAVPHQDTLIVADIQNDMGYDILAQMAMQFFAEGRVPITALSFIYEDKKLEPIFILAKKKPVHKNNKKDD
ncbi:DUF1444 domain-containing protein [Amphibacillus jilinensis]|uniref:DUF1444 domain-containing protein n=1 Tax=Amphibacillus jilinensis TaxID=1216008 RepID=UPI00031C9FFD|nr:DUF1444 domain-containing protein [Amphibacillus jilinensis]